MTEPPFDEHGDRLRRALHAEAEAVTAAPDGLERIRTRIDSRERSFGWLTIPWLRPLAAAGAAVVIAAAAVTATPAIEGFVSASHESTSAQGGNDQSVRLNGPGVPGRPGLPLGTTTAPDGVPRTAVPGQTPGAPMRGTCGPGQVQVLVQAKNGRSASSPGPWKSVCRQAPPSASPPIQVTTPIVTPPPPVVTDTPTPLPSDPATP
jgi:hypothetical protein